MTFIFSIPSNRCDGILQAGPIAHKYGRHNSLAEPFKKEDFVSSHSITSVVLQRVMALTCNKLAGSRAQR